MAFTPDLRDRPVVVWLANVRLYDYLEAVARWEMHQTFVSSIFRSVIPVIEVSKDLRY